MAGIATCRLGQKNWQRKLFVSKICPFEQRSLIPLVHSRGQNHPVVREYNSLTAYNLYYKHSKSSIPLWSQGDAQIIPGLKNVELIKF